MSSAIQIPAGLAALIEPYASCAEPVTLHATTTIAGRFAIDMVDNEWDVGGREMANYPSFDFYDADVRAAGKVIAGNMPWSEDTAPQIRDAFAVANSWRDSHAYPMRSIRYTALWYIRKLGIEGISAARLKRMQAIRRKLRRLPSLRLNQLQDLGGCRVILPTIADVDALVSAVRSGMRHDLRGQDDYISSPKSDGYRSHHLKLSFRGRQATKIYDGRRVELQVRTRLQHSWATAVEAVGLFRGEDLKAHVGSEDWLRLFLLLSGELAEAEGRLAPPNVPDRPLRIAEIRELQGKLDAINLLESVSHGVRGTDFNLAPGYKPTHYLIRFEHSTKRVYVEPHTIPTWATRSYDSAEALDNQTGFDTQNIVLVEVDKIENLKAAYPNYFGDVEMLKQQLKWIARGTGAVEFVPGKEPQPSREIRQQPADPRWLTRNRFLKSNSRASGEQD